MSESLFLVVDLHNGGVLHRAKNREVMVGLLEGLVDAIPYQTFTDLFYPEYAEYDFEKDHLVLSPLDRKIHRMPESLVTEAFLARRARAAEKARYVHRLQMFCEAARDAVSLGVPPEVYADLETELSLCRPEHGVFSPAIHDYASYSSLEPRACYDELRMRVETGRRHRIRNYAIYRRYLDRIHVTEIDGMKQLFADLNKELFLNSHV